ncbi:MAG: 4-hydroxythreonine-4-phosphate dehydrogenase PdxA [Deltaproteobacteria bacterium]|nr:MAG: 4-hydroxythreonine-4-phosphate dehydrogenase PdxA [Deltaproteobacteria bacterium]
MQQGRIGVTMGDPGGVGPEVLVKALASLDRTAWPPLLVYGDEARLEQTARRLDLPNPLSLPDVSLVPHEETQGQSFVWGELTDAGSAAQVGYIQAALQDASTGVLSAIVTGPIHKQALARCGLPYHGHTEWLEDHFDVSQAVMMLAGERLRAVPVTVHVPLRDVPSLLTTSFLLETLTVVHHSMEQWFGMSSPRIAVCGLNPHAGDGGLLGEEDDAVIVPAVEQAQSMGMNVSGPFPGDTVFFFASQGHYDVVLGMYHDQALGPFKLLHFDDGVNVTLGLPLLRTSVDHGTAYDIAGQGIARASSMMNALSMAVTTRKG